MSIRLDDVIIIMGDVLGFKGQRSTEKGTIPLGQALPGGLWWNALLFSGAKTLIHLYPVSSP
jgi:hypothetical protein